MLNTNIIPARSLQKSYKSIIKDVKAKRHAVVLTTNNKPQAAIISLEDLDRLQQTKAEQGTLELLRIADENKEQLKKLPANLRQEADELLYGKS